MGTKKELGFWRGKPSWIYLRESVVSTFTVKIDDKNNCRPSSSKSENKYIMLDTSEQDLNPSYCKIQDTETVDNSNTNGSASKQNLFLGVNRIRKLLYPSHKRKRGR